MKILATIPFALALVLAACSLPMMERSAEYELGYADGCSNAFTQSSGVPRDPRRNESLYANDDGYRRGWNSGNAQCRPDRAERSF
jgi:hypothetical protein